MKKAQRLQNGARYHLISQPGTEAVTVLVLFGVGSRHESDMVWGGSHLIEHMMFKGTKKRPTTLDISKDLDRFGAEFNAYTGKDVTGYYVKIVKDKAGFAVELLYDMLFSSKFDPKEFSREKKVIAEEIKMYEENPIMHIGDLIEEVLFEGTPLSKEIAGTAKSVRDMKRTALLRFKDEHYRPENMVICMAGSVPKDAKTLLERTFGKVKPLLHAHAEQQIALPTRARIQAEHKPLAQIQLALGWVTPGRDHKDVPALTILSNILGGSMSSRLFIEVRERKGLCYSIRTHLGFYKDAGKFLIQAGLDAARLDDAAKTIVREVNKIARHGVTAEELRDTKEHVSGSMQLRLEDSSAQAEFYAHQELQLSKAKTPQERLKEIEAVTKNDVARVAKELFHWDTIAIAGIGPYENAKALAKHFPPVISSKI